VSLSAKSEKKSHKEKSTKRTNINQFSCWLHFLYGFGFTRKSYATLNNTDKDKLIA